MSEQTRQLARVRENIGDCVIEFWQSKLDTDPTFYIEELLGYVGRHRSSAPASPDRILRALRQAGRINYRVLSRSGSKYEVLPL